jgi:hypothetical protein
MPQDAHPQSPVALTTSVRLIRCRDGAMCARAAMSAGSRPRCRARPKAASSCARGQWRVAGGPHKVLVQNHFSTSRLFSLGLCKAVQGCAWRAAGGWSSSPGRAAAPCLGRPGPCAGPSDLAAAQTRLHLGTGTAPAPSSVAAREAPTAPRAMGLWLSTARGWNQEGQNQKFGKQA